MAYGVKTFAHPIYLRWNPECGKHPELSWTDKLEMGIDMKYSGDCDADYINMNIYLADRNRFKFRVLNGDEEMQER